MRFWIPILSDRFLERSRDNYLFVYVHSLLRSRIFTFLLCNAATVYNFVKTLLLLTVSEEAFLLDFVSCVCLWVNISAAMTYR